MDGMYGPPAKRHEGDMYNVQYGGQQPEMYNQYGSSYSGPERRPLQGQYAYPYGRERVQGPGQMPPHGIPPQMMGGPLQPASGEGPQQSLWAARNDMPYPYQGRQGPGGPAQAPPYPGMSRTDDMMVPDQRINHESQWPSHVSQRQPYMSSSASMQPITRPPQSSYQTPPSLPNHISRAPSPASFPRALESRMSPSKSPFLPSMKMQKVMPTVPAPQVTGPPPQPPPIRREITFPPGSVEASQPVLKQRRKITSKDIGKHPGSAPRAGPVASIQILVQLFFLLISKEYRLMFQRGAIVGGNPLIELKQHQGKAWVTGMFATAAVLCGRWLGEQGIPSGCGLASGRKI